MKKITIRDELFQVKRELGVRDDWHEPDEQGVTATVHGQSFDNAGFWPDDERDLNPSARELYVTLYSEAEDGEPVPYATVNLAMLFAWATGAEPAALEHHKMQVNEFKFALQRTEKERDRLIDQYREYKRQAEAKIQELTQIARDRRLELEKLELDRDEDPGPIEDSAEDDVRVVYSLEGRDFRHLPATVPVTVVGTTIRRERVVVIHLEAVSFGESEVSLGDDDDDTAI